MNRYYLGFLLLTFPSHPIPKTTVKETNTLAPIVRQVQSITPIKTLPQTALEPALTLPVVETPKVTAPAPTVVSSGCVTGYSTGDYALDQIISHESGGRSCATNAGGCFGLLQACPGAPLRNACGGDPACQIVWFKANKTGGRSWDSIWASWQLVGWW